MYMYLLLALLTDARPLPWHLLVGIQTEHGTVWLDAPYATQDECSEVLLQMAYAQPTQGPVVAAYCEREPYDV